MIIRLTIVIMATWILAAQAQAEHETVTIPGRNWVDVANELKGIRHPKKVFVDDVQHPKEVVVVTDDEQRLAAELIICSLLPVMDERIQCSIEAETSQRQATIPVKKVVEKRPPLSTSRTITDPEERARVEWMFGLENRRDEVKRKIIAIPGGVPLTDYWDETIEELTARLVEKRKVRLAELDAKTILSDDEWMEQIRLVAVLPLDERNAWAADRARANREPIGPKP